MTRRQRNHELRPPSTPDDRLVGEGELVAAARRGDRAAFTEIVRLHGPRMRALALRLTGSPALADDAVQEAFVRLHGNLPGLRDGGAIGGWLASVTRNYCRDLQRRDLRAPLSDGIDAATTIESPSPGPDEILLRAERLRLLRESLEQLPSPMREILALRFDADLSYQEIARLLDCPLGSVSSRIHRALARLARVLASANHDWEAP